MNYDFPNSNNSTIKRKPSLADLLFDENPTNLQNNTQSELRE